MPTASSAVVADVVGVAVGTTALAFKNLKIFPDSASPATILSPEKVKSRFYLRVTAMDQPGVLAQITAALGNHLISLSAILQRDRRTRARFRW